MFSYLRGELVARHSDHVVLEVGGVGYHINIPSNVFQELPGIGSNLTLHTYLHVREDGLTLYGFSRPEARQLFTLALGVAGIGPRVALSIFGTLSPAAFTQAVITEDHGVLTGIPGIGPKTSRRLVLELKEKLRGLVPELAGSVLTDGEKGAANILQEAMGALLVLGYSLPEARAAVQAVFQPGQGLEDVVRRALQQLGEN